MTSHAARPIDRAPIELADRTLELDMRSAQPEIKRSPKQSESEAGSDDATLELDLSATQIHKLLTGAEAAMQDKPKSRS